jgi:hypothetical protein
MVQRWLPISRVVLLALGAAGAGLWLFLQGPGRAPTERVLPASPAPSLASPTEAERWTTKELRRRCGTVNVASDRYGSHIRPLRGAPQDSVFVYGPTFRGEDWRFFPSDRLEVWWNTRVPTSQVPDANPVKPGRVFHLATVDNMERCRFRAGFTVPHVQPGTYRVVTFIFYEGGYGWFGASRFRVTR